MPDSNITKLALADSLKKLMAEKAFNKIRVDDIVRGCGLTRQSFYYHFKDKYDLMNWIYYTETARFMASYDTLKHWTDGLKDLCYYMQQNKTFVTMPLGWSESLPIETTAVLVGSLSSLTIEPTIRLSILVDTLCLPPWCGI